MYYRYVHAGGCTASAMGMDAAAVMPLSGRPSTAPPHATWSWRTSQVLRLATIARPSQGRFARLRSLDGGMLLPRTTRLHGTLARGARRALSSSSSSSSSSTSSDKTTHFGYTTVPKDEKEHLVKGVFERVASRYDLMNDLMSAGVHRVWKDTVVGLLGCRHLGMHNHQHLDVAGGTGDIAFRIAHDLTKCAEGRRTATGAPHARAAAGEPPGGRSRIVVSDINPSMLAEGEKRAQSMAALSSPAAPEMEWVTADARKLPFDDGTFDAYTIAFGLRNVTVIEEALAEACRVLRPGGRFLCLEFSHVAHPVLALAYEKYSFDVIPALGELVANDRESYQYLVESIRKFPKQEELLVMMRCASPAAPRACAISCLSSAT